jgi:hypothetical protein
LKVHLNASAPIELKIAFAQDIVQMQYAQNFFFGVDDRKDGNLVLFHNIQGVIRWGTPGEGLWIFGHDLFDD